MTRGLTALTSEEKDAIRAAIKAAPKHQPVRGGPRLAPGAGKAIAERFNVTEGVVKTLGRPPANKSRERWA